MNACFHVSVLKLESSYHHGSCICSKCVSWIAILPLHDMPLKMCDREQFLISYRSVTQSVMIDKFGL